LLEKPSHYSHSQRQHNNVTVVEASETYNSFFTAGERRAESRVAGIKMLD